MHKNEIFINLFLDHHCHGFQNILVTIFSALMCRASPSAAKEAVNRSDRLNKNSFLLHFRRRTEFLCHSRARDRVSLAFRGKISMAFRPARQSFFGIPASEAKFLWHSRLRGKVSMAYRPARLSFFGIPAYEANFLWHSGLRGKVYLAFPPTRQSFFGIPAYEAKFLWHSRLRGKFSMAFRPTRQSFFGIPAYEANIFGIPAYGTEFLWHTHIRGKVSWHSRLRGIASLAFALTRQSFGEMPADEID